MCFGNESLLKVIGVVSAFEPRLRQRLLKQRVYFREKCALIKIDWRQVQRSVRKRCMHDANM